jgi:hypothetical protein
MRAQAVTSAALQDRELVPSHSRYDIVRPTRAAQAIGNFLEQFVSDPVPKSIVDQLESIEVHKEHRRIGAVRPPQGSRHRLQDLTASGQTREFVHFACTLRR